MKFMPALIGKTIQIAQLGFSTVKYDVWPVANQIARGAYNGFQNGRAATQHDQVSSRFLAVWGKSNQRFVKTPNANPQTAESFAADLRSKGDSPDSRINIIPAASTGTLTNPQH